MIEKIIELGDKLVADKLDEVWVVRCKNCIYAEGVESSQFRFCVKHAEFVPLNGYCFEARGSQ